jgi:hypothetical protein
MAFGRKIVDGPLVGDIFSSNLISFVGMLLRVESLMKWKEKRRNKLN